MNRRRSVTRALMAVLIPAFAVALLSGAASVRASTATSAHVRSFFVPVAASPGSSARIRLDVDIYTPAVTPAPAVLLAHGFGQTKTALAPEARTLQAAGYVVLAYTARGFGRSGGSIGLDSLDGEVPDARALVDVLAADRDVESVKGDPVVGVVGGSYGGALALMLGATDHRIDTVVAAITWNDLADALDPRSAGAVARNGSGVGRTFKTAWASRLFGASITPTQPCGRFTAQFCAVYTHLIAGKPLTASDTALLERSSPSTVLSGMRAPTLLLQGLQDDLFGLDQADANASALQRAGAPVQVRWFNGGHDGGGIAGTDAIIRTWLDDHLKAHHSVPAAFDYAVPPNATAFGQTVTAARYPGLGGAGTARSITLAGPQTSITNPPGGEPASVTGLPGLDVTSTAGRAVGGLLAAANPPAEAARFTSSALKSPIVIAGAATVRLRVTPGAGAGAVAGAQLFAQLSVVNGDATRVLPGGVAPIHVPLPAGGTVVTVTLPATAWSFTPGDRIELTIRTSDSEFQSATDPATYLLAIDGPISMPTVAPVAVAQSAGEPSLAVLLGILATTVLALLLITGAVLRSRSRAARAQPPVSEGSVPAPPLQIHGLTKRFGGGFLAADDVSFTVERGQVLGLLGENGAGKTTTLRMAVGLIRPDSGSVQSFGAPVGPGAPVLTRIGCFIEGPGFLPQLSGRRNLELYWAATGRLRHAARIDEVLAVADLGTAIEKPVRGYSQGMRQRLAIAQAMLGMPDLLVLDEPTNGLDPPQIAALRGVLRRYAEGGRTVVVSSHLLGEVELTCTHVVVMAHGRVVATGAVGDIAGDSSELVIGVTDVDAAIAAVRSLGVEQAERHEPDGIRVTPGLRTANAVVAALVEAGVGVTEMRLGRHLEEAFLDLVGAKERTP